MAYCAGLDVSVKETSICIMDDKGIVAARTDISTDPDLITSFISKHAPNVERVVHESGILAIWLTRELENRLMSAHSLAPHQNAITPARWIGRVKYPNVVIVICADYYTQRRQQ